jgi:putative selenium metabolism protein SsnA
MYNSNTNCVFGGGMLIVNSKVITWTIPNLILEDNAILVLEDRIAEMGRTEEMTRKYLGEERLDACGQYLMPGLICAHTHFYGAFSRGMSIPGTPPRDFPDILEKLWWPLDRVLVLDDVRDSAFVCLIDAIRHGTTTLIDHHASPNAIDGSLDVIADAVDWAGVRAALCYEITDRNGHEGAHAGIRENLRFVEALNKNPNPRIGAKFGLHASLTVSENTLEEARKACPDDIGFHIHVAEHSVDEYDSLQKYGERVVDRLYRQGILGPSSIVVHAVHVDAREIELLAESGTWVTHQPRSNMNNAVGLPDIESMLRSGIRVGLGNDGFSNAMWEEWKAAYFSHKLLTRDPRVMQADKIVQMAIYNNAQLAESIFKTGQIGRIEPGAVADLILVDYHPFTPLNPGNLPWHIIFGFHESMVTMTMVAGKIFCPDCATRS